MPITFAHPVAVLPLQRWGFPLSALIVGSVAPDLEYLMHLAPRSVIGHTPVGLFVFCIPVGLLFLWVLHRVWKRPFLALFVGGHCVSTVHRPDSFAFWPLRRLIMLGTAVLIGSLTHLVWDSFTHQYGWMVQRVPALNTVIFQTNLGSLPLFKFLQHGSSAVGITMLVVMTMRQGGWTRHVTATGWGLLVRLCAISVAAGVCVALFQTGHLSSVRAVKKLVGISIVASTSALIAAVTILSLIWHARVDEEGNSHQ